MSIAGKLDTVSYRVDQNPHIVVDSELCGGCNHHPCRNFCPANCFTDNGKGGIDYYYVGCLECGTCLIMCDQKAVRWNYPRGGYGISYRF